MIKLNKISKSYGRNKVISDLDFTFERGVNLILGPNGAGKSTLLKILANIIKANTGNFYYNSKQSLSTSDFSYSPAEDESFFLHLTGYENLEMFSLLKNGKSMNLDCEVMNRFYKAILPILDKPFHTYSSGMRKKLNLYRAMLSNKRVMLIDEPFANLDQEMSLLFKEYLEKYQHERVLLVATHRDKGFFEGIVTRELNL